MNSQVVGQELSLTLVEMAPVFIKLISLVLL